MIKELKWDDQWMGYDDDETFAMKLGVANDLCMGGSMVWSIDFDPKILEWSPAPANETFDPVQARKDGFFTAEQGDAVVLVSNAVKIPSLGKYRYQYNLYGVRKGQTFNKDSNSIDDGINGPLDPTLVGSSTVDPVVSDSLPASPHLQPRPKFQGFTYRGLICNFDPIDTDDSLYASSMTCTSALAGAEGLTVTVPCVLNISPVTPILMGLCKLGYCSSLDSVCYLPSESSLNPRAGGNTPGASRFISLRDVSVQWFLNLAKSRPGKISLFYTQKNVFIPGQEGLSEVAKEAAKSVHVLITIWEMWPNSDLNPAVIPFDSFYSIDLGKLGASILADIAWKGDPDEPIPWDSPQYIWFRVMSAAYAFLAVGRDALVVTETPGSPKMSSIFWYVEWLVLTGAGEGYVDRDGTKWVNKFIRRVIATNLDRTEWWVLWDLDGSDIMKDGRISYRNAYRLLTPPFSDIGPRDWNFEGSCIFNPVQLPGEGCDRIHNPERTIYNGQVYYQDFFG
ncbi:hypothetical protein ABW20_dc0106593 [Dactylellina cionopaga]|nr:hypothetical protein ABW20_dc0106593 [Dactylellina cionopaga]